MVSNSDLLSIIKNQIIAKNGNIIDDIVLFGSRINGASAAESDYDLLVVLNKQYDWKLKDKIIESLIDVEIENNIIIDLHVISTYDINNTLRGMEPIYQNALKFGLHAA